MGKLFFCSKIAQNALLDYTTMIIMPEQPNFLPLDVPTNFDHLSQNQSQPKLSFEDKERLEQVRRGILYIVGLFENLADKTSDADFFQEMRDDQVLGDLRDSLERDMTSYREYEDALANALNALSLNVSLAPDISDEASNALLKRFAVKGLLSLLNSQFNRAKKIIEQKSKQSQTDLT